MSDLASKKISNVPVLRFDFNGCWNQFKLNQFATKITFKNKNKAIKNVICNSATQGLIKQIDFFDKDIAVLENTSSYFVIEKNNFVYNPRKSITAPYGPVNKYDFDEPGVVSPLYLCFKIENINFDFLLYRFKSKCWHRYIYLNGDSGARHDRVSIKDSVFLAQPILLPSLDEQIKIASFLRLIDQQIEVQNRLIKDLISLKYGLAKKIFIQLNANSCIGDYLKEYNEKNINNYEPVAVGKNGIRKRSEVFNRELSNDYTKNKVISKNSLIIGMGTKEIDIAILFENKNYCVSPAYKTFKIQNVNPHYFDELLRSMNYLLSLRYMISSARQGKSVNKKELLSHKIFVHSKEEQNYIAKLFELVDEKISNEKNKLALYLNQRNYLLDKLFI